MTFTDKFLLDLRPREGLIAACLLLLIFGIGIYPKLATDLFENKVAAMTASMHQTQVITSLYRTSDLVNE